MLEYSEYILKRAEEESEEEHATAQAGTSEEQEVTTLTGAAELKDDDESHGSAHATDLGLGSFLSLDAPSADEETAGVAEAAEESAERVEEVFVLTIVFDYTHISSVFLSIF